MDGRESENPGPEGARTTRATGGATPLGAKKRKTRPTGRVAFFNRTLGESNRVAAASGSEREAKDAPRGNEAGWRERTRAVRDSQDCRGAGARPRPMVARLEADSPRG